MKVDKSYNCKLAYFDMCIKRLNQEITEEEFQDWFNRYCLNCLYMCEICMYGEDDYGKET